VDESALEPELRARLGALLPPEWRDLPGAAQRAWTQQVPVFRVVASSGEPIGQVAICLLREKDPTVLGIGDLVVTEAFRGRGVGSALIREAVAAAGSRGGETIVVASRNPKVRHVFHSLGFRACRPHELVFRQGDLVSWNETWLVRGADGHDLVEVVGDV
jgi:predicted N-acetyltransferase YhbS